jgi:MOSC domain-containing protein
VRGIHDAPRTLLVTTEATLRGLGDELGRPVDPRRFRPNLLLDLDAPAWAELGWEGVELVFAGGVRLHLVDPCERCAIPTRDPDTQMKWPGLLKHLASTHDQCFGIYARVLTGGRIAAGEAVELLD